MIKVRYAALAGLTLLMFLVTSCSGTPTPEVVVITATSQPATEAPTIQPTATFVPIALSGPQNGSTMDWVDGSNLIYIPAGDFTMGDGFYALSHNVTLDGYWIQETKVTNRMYDQCVKVGQCTSPAQVLGGPVFNNPIYGSHPVVGVNWDQAQAYCGWIQGSLPTEAQWEKAARGTQGNTYPWGEAAGSCNLLNFSNCYESTTNVDSFPSNTSQYGLLDMAGNAFEWAYDWYGEAYYNESPSANPTGPATGQYRVVRGSSFETDKSQIASAIRRFNEPGDSQRDTGFRCAVANPQPVAPYCQLTSFIPEIASSSDVCQLPEGVVTSQYCQQGETYATVQISFNSTWEPRGTRLSCVESTASGIRQLTCSGPETIESTNEIVLCNTACTDSPIVEGVAPICSPGYTLDPATGYCNYTPIIGQVSVAGCPAGYLLVDRGGGQQVCAVTKGADGSCPAGLYFDELAGLCMPPNGETTLPYGIDNPGLAAQTYAGCANGYNYSEGFQCCQAQVGGSYPGCQPGYAFSADLKSCIPTATELTGQGCTTVRVTTLKCKEPENTCAKFNDSESRCVANFCSWNEQAARCEMRTP